MTLILAADAAYPFDYNRLPADITVIMGYFGGDTPHIWTDTEIASALRTGREWWAIWTAPSRQGSVLNAAQGTRDGQGMAGACHARGYSTDKPVFYDVEHAAWVNNPGGAMDAIQNWKTVMHVAGYQHTCAYVPYTANFDWVAYWDNIRPTSLPVGWVGHQFGGQPGFDLSVFDTERLGLTMSLTQTDADLVVNTLINRGGVAGYNGTFSNLIKDIRDRQIRMEATLNQFIKDVTVAFSNIPLTAEMETDIDQAVTDIKAAIVASCGAPTGEPTTLNVTGTFTGTTS
jgi:hypothetical protein